jgi:hypothetical protein
MPLNEITLPHLRSLTSLELHSYPGDVGQLWRSLLAEGIQLTELITERISDELLCYLALYSGLKTLQIESMSPDLTNLVDKLFRDVLSRHMDTLETLYLRTWFEGPWCFGQSNADLILKCQKLSVLSMSVEYNLWDKDKSDKSSDPLVRFNSLFTLPRIHSLKKKNQLFILEKTAHLPCLHKLTLLSSEPLSNRYNGCGNLGMRYTQEVDDKMQATIRDFLPDPAVHPGVVQLDEQMYRIDLREEAGQERWRYLPFS